ncbi:DNRLRE domain-containing protein [Stigmatella sp. ncwal1]|uniref:DNRLRE domain-containing protein n=1 Tax=Stigmatella ashevillensis TaxID=2995309 RepID=A0ABT5DC87_9BACT|nr:DNRLRE domain-containing protein [Stigmatella ashevillena]MDC0711248.1 DNRLRE domain-containing protein [Stigmatella ashevillena]
MSRWTCGAKGMVCATALGVAVGCHEGGEPEDWQETQSQELLETRTFAAVADARVEATNSGQNFGTSSTLKADTSPDYSSYLRFELSGLTGTVRSAKLRLYMTDASTTGPAVSSTGASWQESTLTFQNKPAVGTRLSTVSTVTANSWAEWDVTAAVQGNGAVNLVVTSTGTDGTVFSSRETSQADLRPQLVVTVDGGTTPPPSGGDWTFYSAAQGVPRYVYGVSADAGGNLWVAGGEEGLFVLQKGQTQFRRFTMADGLRPYGYMLDGSAPSGVKYLKVISVAGGPAGVAFVGYEGKQPASGMPTCEDEWDQAYYAGRTPDASVYKSGDADRVTLTSTGIQVVHYDLSTGPNKVAAEPRGREKVCNIWRIAYDENTQSVWFGGNHGFAWGRANFPGYSCAPGTWDYSCAGVMEHVHPAINAWNTDGTKLVLLTDAYWGVSVASNGDVWFGGANRSTRFRYGTNGNNYWTAQSQSEDSAYAWNRYDIWPDAVSEPTPPTRAQRVDDHVSGMAVMSDQSVWVGSFTRGLAQLDASGQRLRTLSTELADKTGYVGAVAADPRDNSVWAGMRWGGGLSRIHGSTVVNYGSGVIPDNLIWVPVQDIQVDRSTSPRRVLIGFQGTDSVPGTIGVYTGP